MVKKKTMLVGNSLVSLDTFFGKEQELSLYSLEVLGWKYLVSFNIVKYLVSRKIFKKDLFVLLLWNKYNKHKVNYTRDLGYATISRYFNWEHNFTEPKLKSISLFYKCQPKSYPFLAISTSFHSFLFYMLKLGSTWSCFIELYTLLPLLLSLESYDNIAK